MKLPSDGWITAVFVGFGVANMLIGLYYGVVEEEWAHGLFNLFIGYIILEEV